MNRDTYWIIRWIVFGLGFGLFNAFLINKDVGWGWMAGYTLCWIFSYLNDASLGDSE